MSNERTFAAAMTWLAANLAILQAAWDDDATYPTGIAALWQRQEGGFLIEEPDVDHVGDGSGSTLVGRVYLADETLSPRAEYTAERGGKSWWFVAGDSGRHTVCGTAAQVDAYMSRLDGDRTVHFHQRCPITCATTWARLEDGDGDVDLDAEEAALAAA